MKQRLALISLVVKDYDEAIEFYTQNLDFVLLEGTKINSLKRWVVIALTGAKESCILLDKADNEQQTASIGNQTGGRIFLSLFTDEFLEDYNKMIAQGIRFVRSPKKEPYGTVAVFKDLYGNMWDLLELSKNNKGLIKN